MLIVKPAPPSSSTPILHSYLQIRLPPPSAWPPDERHACNPMPSHGLDNRKPHTRPPQVRIRLMSTARISDAGALFTEKQTDGLPRARQPAAQDVGCACLEVPEGCT